MESVLFLCTGNYYRSRFAEELFNHRSANAAPDWQARSRALAIERGKFNIGPLSPFTLRGLEQRGVIAKGNTRLPQQCTVTDLEAADQVVALDETEHRPLMRERFSDWEHSVQYWAIGNVAFMTPDYALRLIDERIDAFLAELEASHRCPYSCTMLTCSPNKVMAELHDRMPVILAEKDWPQWLGEEPASEQELLALLKPCPDEAIKTWPVSKIVGNDKNIGPQLVEPVS
jgi:low molecular weight protein-tyrosine phosphatase